MSRFCLSFVFMLALLAAVGSRTAKAEDVLSADTMKVALHTATPEEDGFIEYVLAKVDEGILPADMVHSTFRWAQKKPRNKFQYFKRGLILRAAEAGINLTTD